MDTLSHNATCTNPTVWIIGSLQVIRSSLGTLQKTLKGLVVMSANIETLANNFFQQKMPVLWAPFQLPNNETSKQLLQRIAGQAQNAARLDGLRPTYKILDQWLLFHSRIPHWCAAKFCKEVSNPHRYCLF